MISVENLCVKIGNATILKDISLDIPRAKLSVVLGKNGAGKSTLLRAACGDISPSAGCIRYKSKLLSKTNTSRLAQSRAVVLQHVSLSFSFSVLEVVLMGRIPHTRGLETVRDRDIALQCMQKMGIIPLKNRNYPSLSGGEKQRVQLARALAQIWDALEEKRPCYLLLDEPTASLDIARQHQLLALLSELAGQGATVFIVLHDLNLAAQYADIITILKDGKKLATGSVKEIFQPDLIQHVFECPVQIMHNPYCDCPLIVADSHHKRQDNHLHISSSNLPLNL